MASHKPAIDGDNFALRLGVFYGGIFVAMGIQLPYLPVWLATKGLDATAIGIVLAIPILVRVVAVPAVTRLADRASMLRGVLIATAAATAAGCALVGLAGSFTTILLAMMVMSAAYTPVMPLADAYALKGLRTRGRAYGPVRLWGSVAFVFGNLAAGFLADAIDPSRLIWLIAAAYAATALASPLLARVGTEAPSAMPAAASAGAFLCSPAFLTVAAAAGLVQASHAVYYGFSTLAWSAKGLDGAAIGALWALGVAAEIVLFALSGRLRLPPAAFLMIGAAGALVRWSAMAFDPPAAMLPFLQVLHGLSFGATHLGAVQFLARAAPDGLGATAQGYLSIVLGVAMAAAMGLSGMLVGAFGNFAYWAMAASALLGGLLALAADKQLRGVRPV